MDINFDPLKVATVLWFGNEELTKPFGLKDLQKYTTRGISQEDLRVFEVSEVLNSTIDVCQKKYDVDLEYRDSVEILGTTFDLNNYVSFVRQTTLECIIREEIIELTRLVYEQTKHMEVSVFEVK